MITKEIESRFNIVNSVPTEYSISLPILLPDKEILFTYNWEGKNDGKYLILHDMYILNVQNNNLEVKNIEEEIKDEGVLHQGLMGIEAFKVEEKFIHIYERVRGDLIQSKNEVSADRDKMEEYFDLLITNKVLRDVYLRIGARVK